MTNDIERHSPEVWRKAADSLRGEADASDAVAKVNRNGAPLLGDTRDLFRPKTGDIPAQPGVYKWRDGEGRVIYVGKPAQPVDQLLPAAVSAASAHADDGAHCP